MPQIRQGQAGGDYCRVAAQQNSARSCGFHRACRQSADAHGSSPCACCQSGDAPVARHVCQRHICKPRRRTRLLWFLARQCSIPARARSCIWPGPMASSRRAKCKWARRLKICSRYQPDWRWATAWCSTATSSSTRRLTSAQECQGFTAARRNLQRYRKPKALQPLPRVRMRRPAW